MPAIEVEPGVSIYAQDVGEGTPVVLLAGFGLSHPVWDRQVRVLTTAGHRVICVDLRGTGRSDKPVGDYSVSRLALDVERALAELRVAQATVAGWSFGGQVAFALAASAPERVARLALICSNGVRASRADSFPYGADAAATEAALVRGEEGDRLAARRRTLALGFAREPAGELLDWLLRCQLEMPSWAAVACYRSYLNTDLSDLLPAVRQPVLQVLGAEDPVTPLDGARWLQDRLAGEARLVVLPGCGHYPLFESPAALDEALLEIAAR